MGCRGVYGFRINDEDKVTYTHCGGCPDGAGVKVLKFLKAVTNEQLKKIAQGVILVDEDDVPTEEQIEICREAGLVNLNVSEQNEKDWYCLMRNAQDNLFIYMETPEKKAIPYMRNSCDFTSESLFCEGAYILNIDTGMFEIYTGFNKDINAKGRYASLCANINGFCGVRLIWEIPFEEAREMEESEFISKAESFSNN